MIPISADLIKVIESIKVDNNPQSDWIDGLLVAADMINTECGKKKYQKWVFLITDGESKLFGADDIDPIINGLNESEIRVNMITLDFCNDLEDEINEGDEEMKGNHWV